MLIKLFRHLVNAYQEEDLKDHLESCVSPEVCGKLQQKIKSIEGLANVLQPLNKTRFVIFDTETTGFNPANGDRVISVGAVVFENGALDPNQQFHRFVNPNRTIPNEIIELTGITHEMVCEAENFFEVFTDFLDFLDNGLLVAHNADFDINFINRRLHYCQAKLQCPVVDTLKISYLLHPRLKSHSLDVLLNMYEIPSINRHTALGDALLTGQLFEKFLVQLKNNHVSTLLDLYNHLHLSFKR